jgi:hypothetical protein
MPRYCIRSQSARMDSLDRAKNRVNIAGHPAVCKKKLQIHMRHGKLSFTKHQDASEDTQCGATATARASRGSPSPWAARRGGCTRGWPGQPWGSDLAGRAFPAAPDRMSSSTISPGGPSAPSGFAQPCSNGFCGHMQRPLGQTQRVPNAAQSSPCAYTSGLTTNSGRSPRSTRRTASAQRSPMSRSDSLV